MIVIAHISDTHFDGGDRATGRAAAVMDYIRGLPTPVDAIVVSGDITDHGTEAEYEQARDTLSADVPVLVLPGNHDARSTFREVLLRKEFSGADAEDPTGTDAPVNRVREVGGAVFLLCDSVIPGRDEGLLDDDTIAWLDERLTEVSPEAPALICVHHPPVKLHDPFVDALGMRGADRLARVIEKHPRVAGVLCGHAHAAAATTFAGRPLLVAPGVVSTGLLPWEHGGMSLDLPPGLAFHVLDEENRLTTHYRVVPHNGRSTGQTS
ncbi:metallophosphoesterase [Allokutzneria sp. A3M-2-11 16]|uniref:metallophosphoesterase n=1 Tax=Allokutzneria sp. A3M-2-11 16 TaxID=2962043 RepID=UPI0020B68BE3|nr:metallophosphoesterase [Allokutzneria sp. A3M-2-11 16]MCP3804456.1 metallophosphoesterase [Allokutzneria sp. A3M-2-11 16]